MNNKYSLLIIKKLLTEASGLQLFTSFHYRFIYIPPNPESSLGSSYAGFSYTKNNKIIIVYKMKR